MKIVIVGPCTFRNPETLRWATEGGREYSVPSLVGSSGLGTKRPAPLGIVVRCFFLYGS
jgi:hypothetical protein